jgi:hypothetical protein
MPLASFGSVLLPRLRYQTTLPSPQPTIKSGKPSPSQSAATGWESPWVIGAAAVLALAAVGGLTAVLAVQRQANVQLEAKNLGNCVRWA